MDNCNFSQKNVRKVIAKAPAKKSESQTARRIVERAANKPIANKCP